jgi:hypothetical protein
VPRRDGRRIRHPWIERTYKNRLYPEFGDKRLDAIDDEDVQRLKGRLADRNRKTVNNVLGILGTRCGWRSAGRSSIAFPAA